MQAASIVRTIAAEIPNYPGVAFDVKEGGKHKRIVFSKGEESRFLTIPRSPSDWRAGANAMRDFRKTMRELGAERLEPLPKMRRLRGGAYADLAISLNAKNFVVHVPATSKILDRFKTADGKPASHWRVELRASPDLEAPPMLVLTRGTIPAGQVRKQGLVGGFTLAKTGAWRLLWARHSLKFLKRIDTIAPVTVELYEETAKELVFKLPPGTIPTTFKRIGQAAKADIEEAPKPLEAPPAPMPVAALAPAPAPMATTLVNDQPITLQLPRQSVSVEQAIAVLNKAKRRLGNNLRFTIVEEGYLTAVHRIGA